jgi:hypothetical protein
MRALAVIVIILGLAALVFGILFIPQASSAEKEIADSIAPLPLNQVEAKYDAAKAAATAQAAKEADQIKVANPSATYLYLSGQRTSLGLAKANIGTAKFVRLNGIIDILVGLGLVLAGLGLLRKSQSAA